MSEISKEQHRRLEELIRSVGAKLLEFWPGPSAENAAKKFSVKTKGDGTLVTEADLLASKMLSEGIVGIFPEDKVISEESPIDPSVRNASSVWIIDPIDGTNSFIDGLDDFCILAARVIGNRSRAAYMYFPARKLFLWGHNGSGVSLNGQAIRTSTSPSLRESGLYVHNDPRIVDQHSTKEWMHSGVAFLRLCLGDFDGLIVRMGRLQEWDLATPVLLIEECGGKVTDESGKPLLFNQGKIAYSYLVASNGHVHDNVLAILRPFLNSSR